MRSLLQQTALLTLLLAAFPVAATAQQEDDDSFLRVPVPEEGEDRIHRLRTQVRHTTVIVLPAGENILDFVVGDSEYWHLTGAANVAFLKPLRPDAATNIALVCESGRIYSFLVAEQSDGPPHLVVRVESGAEAARLSGGSGRPAFVARSEVAAYQQMAAEAAEAAEAREAEAASWRPGRRLSRRSRRSVPAIRSVSRSSTGSTGTRRTGRSWSKRCGTTGSSPTSGPTPRSRRPSMSSGTASRRSSLTTSQRTVSTSPAMCWPTDGSRSATSGPAGGSRRREGLR